MSFLNNEYRQHNRWQRNAWICRIHNNVLDGFPIYNKKHKFNQLITWEVIGNKSFTFNNSIYKFQFKDISSTLLPVVSSLFAPFPPTLWIQAMDIHYGIEEEEECHSHSPWTLSIHRGVSRTGIILVGKYNKTFMILCKYCYKHNFKTLIPFLLIPTKAPNQTHFIRFRCRRVVLGGGCQGCDSPAPHGSFEVTLAVPLLAKANMRIHFARLL